MPQVAHSWWDEDEDVQKPKPTGNWWEEDADAAQTSQPIQPAPATPQALTDLRRRNESWWNQPEAAPLEGFNDLLPKPKEGSLFYTPPKPSIGEQADAYMAKG